MAFQTRTGGPKSPVQAPNSAQLALAAKLLGDPKVDSP